jgi:hypothetical protein
MVDRELPKRTQKHPESPAQASACSSEQPHGSARAVAGLSPAATRRIVALREPATGESRHNLVRFVDLKT